MPRVPPSSAGIKSRTLIITWLLALALGAYVVENLWIDGWMRAKFAGLPTLVPEPLTPFWFAVFGFGGICCIVLVVCLVLVSQHRSVRLRTKVWTGVAVVGACLLWGAWFNSTKGATAEKAAAPDHKKHLVKLRWVASTSPV